MFTQHSHDAITVTRKMRHFRHFTSEHYKVSKSEVFEKVIAYLLRIFESMLMTHAKNCQNWWMCVKAIASQTCDIFETQCITTCRCQIYQIQFRLAFSPRLHWNSFHRSKDLRIGGQGKGRVPRSNFGPKVGRCIQQTGLNSPLASPLRILRTRRFLRRI